MGLIATIKKYLEKNKDKPKMVMENPFKRRRKDIIMARCPKCNNDKAFYKGFRCKCTKCGWYYDV